jgi:hypothetical protein
MVLEVLLLLGRILDPDDGGLRDSLKLAVESPATFFEKHSDTADRAGSPSNKSLGWLALVDGLIARKLATELDWRTSGEDATWSLSQLKTYDRLSVKTRTWLPTLDHESFATVDYLRKLAPHADADGVIVAVMDIDSDSYIVLLLQKDQYAKATDAAAKLGYILKDVRDHDPNE